MTTDIPEKGDTSRINAALQKTWERGVDIDDALARRIGKRLSDDGPLHEFAETGAISRELRTVLAAMASEADEPHGIWIAALERYCEQAGLRGPVTGWNEALGHGGGVTAGGDRRHGTTDRQRRR